jgi:hypothetical protein
MPEEMGIDDPAEAQPRRELVDTPIETQKPLLGSKVDDAIGSLVTREYRIELQGAG